MRWTSNHVLLAAANVLIPIAVLAFATGFFPYKPFVPGLAAYQQLDYGDPPMAKFDKVIFMVVDALRSDFVYSKSSGFKFTQRLVTLLAQIAILGRDRTTPGNNDKTIYRSTYIP
jgi:ethanolaminephosphotransferase